MNGTKLTRMTLLLLTLTLIPVISYADAWQDGVAAFKSGNLAAAEKSFLQVVELMPDWPGGHLMLGQTLLRAERAPDALPALETAYRLAPENADGMLALAQTRLVLGDATAAEDLLAGYPMTEMRERQRTAALSTHGKVLMALRRPAEAAPILAEAAELSGDGRLDRLLGRAWLESDNSAAALPLLEQAATRSPDDGALAELLTRALHSEALAAEPAMKAELCTRAAGTAARALAIETTNTRRRLLGEAQTCAGLHADAFETFSGASGADANGWLMKFYAGREAALLERWAEAETWLRASLAAEPGETYSGRVWKQLGYVYESQQQYTEAIEAYGLAGADEDVARATESNRRLDQNRYLDQLANEIDEIRRQQDELGSAAGSIPY